MLIVKCYFVHIELTKFQGEPKMSSLVKMKHEMKTNALSMMKILINRNNEHLESGLDAMIYTKFSKPLYIFDQYYQL